MSEPAGFRDQMIRTYYHGRKWDAPVTDDSIDLAYAAESLLGNDDKPLFCDLCQERLTMDDDVLFQPAMKGHIECVIRSFVGDVQHLEGRCGICDHTEPRPLPSDETKTYREASKATLQWMQDHNRGRFHD